MNKANALGNADLMTNLTFFFLLISVVLIAQIGNEEQLNNFQGVKSPVESSASVPDYQEMARVYFVLNENKQPQIYYKGEKGEKQLVSDSTELESLIIQDAPHYLAIKADNRYPYQDIGWLYSKAAPLGVQLALVTENEQ